MLRLVCLIAALAASSAAAQRLPVRLRPATLDTPAALQRAAHELFRPGRGAVLDVTLRNRRLEHALGCEIETWAVAGDETGPLGTFVRVRAWPLPDCSVDLALRLEDGSVRAATALRPLILGGAAFPALPQALAKMPDVPLAAWAPLAARLFAALAHVEAGLRGARAPAPPGERAASAAIDALEKLHPPLLPGAEFPALEVPDETGARFAAERFLGRGALIVAASVKHADSRALIARIAPYASERPGRFALIWVLADRPPAIAAYRERGGRLDGLVVPDPARTVRDALRVSVLPALFAFDAKRRLVGYMRAPWPAGDAFAEALDALPFGGTAGAAAGSAPPSPTTTPGLPAVEADRLAAAGRKLLKLADKGELVVEADRTVERWSDGWALQRLEARDRGAIAAVEPLAPLRAGGREAAGLAELVAAVSHRSGDVHGAALARVMDALAAAARPAAAPAGARLAVKIATPGLAVGQALPEFAGAGLDGKPVKSAELAGKPALVVVLDRAPVAELAAALIATAAARAELQIMVVVAGTAADARAVLPASPALRVLADPEGRVISALQPPHGAYLYGVSPRGQIVARGSWSGLASLAAVLPPAAR